MKRASRLLAAIWLGIAPFAQSAVAATVAPSANQAETIDAFYAARGNRPLWLASGGDEPRLLLDWLRTAAADGLSPDIYQIRDLERALGRAGAGNPAATLRADRLLSEAFVHYVRDLRRMREAGMIWVDPELRPSSAFPRQIMAEAAAAPSLRDYVAAMRWMNPVYVGLRRAMLGGREPDPALLALNLERARALPAGSGRAVIVNASAAQLDMVDNGRVVDTMRVVVGKPVYPTPVMAALIRYTSLNPYWNVPPDLAAERIAPQVVKEGKGYLKSKGYQVLGGWGEQATVVSPDTVDWPAVAAGRQEVRIRQLPGPSNAMGRMKFMFPNAQGVYLHDTPDKDLLGAATRMFSGGCVRLEDAPRLARWLFEGSPPSPTSARAEQRVDLPRPVPVYLVYLTAVPTDGGVKYFPDVYHRDPPARAALVANRTVTGF